MKDEDSQRSGGRSQGSRSQQGGRSNGRGEGGRPQGSRQRPDENKSGRGPRGDRSERPARSDNERPNQPKREPQQQPNQGQTQHQRGERRPHKKAHTGAHHPGDREPKREVIGAPTGGERKLKIIAPAGPIIKPVHPIKKNQDVPNSLLGLFKKIFSAFFKSKK